MHSNDRFHFRNPQYLLSDLCRLDHWNCRAQPRGPPYAYVQVAFYLYQLVYLHLDLYYVHLTLFCMDTNMKYIEYLCPHRLLTCSVVVTSTFLFLYCSMQWLN